MLFDDPPCPYRTLGLPRSAPLAAVRAAFRAAALARHPDRPGGDAAAFACARTAFETLADPAARAAHDAAAVERAGARARAAAARARRARAPAGGEAALLAALAGTVDAACQLVTTCVVCGRPATFDCAACGQPVCELCTRERHAAPRARPHWPVRSSDHMEAALAARQLEAKRVADAAAADAGVAGARSAAALAAVRAFRDAVAETDADPAARDAALAPLWAWAQTDDAVFIAVAVPPGEPDAPPIASVSADGRVAVGAPRFPCTLDAALDRPLAPETPVRVLASGDGRVAVLTLAKGAPYGRWRRLRAGDGDGFRCVDPPYVVRETDAAVDVEFLLPGWVTREDVRVSVDGDGVRVDVEGVVNVARRFWAPAPRAVDPDAASWTLTMAPPPSGGRLLTLTLPRPSPTAPPLSGAPAPPPAPRHNGHEPRPWPGAPAGVAYFVEDDDPHGLADALAAAVVAAGGAARVRAPPGGGGGAQDAWVGDAAGLPPRARRHLEAMMEAEEGEEGG